MQEFLFKPIFMRQILKFTLTTALVTPIPPTCKQFHDNNHQKTSIIHDCLWSSLVYLISHRIISHIKRSLLVSRPGCINVRSTAETEHQNAVAICPAGLGTYGTGDAWFAFYLLSDQHLRKPSGASLHIGLSGFQSKRQRRRTADDFLSIKLTFII